MKTAITAIIFVFFVQISFAQSNTPAENIYIITTDGFRWQELFTGADSALINDERYVGDIPLMKQLYWDNDIETRRRKLMPFMWEVIAKDGQIYGNRLWGNKSNAANPYKISYPGYNEIFTGYPDPRIMLNIPRSNKNINILECLNNDPTYHGKVVTFSSWYVFPFILSAKRNGLPVNSGYENMQGEDSVFGLIDRVQDNISPKNHTRYDWLTYINAKEYIDKHHPKIVFLSLGETDEFAHEGHYDQYLQHANAVDKMIEDLWYFVQTSPDYKGKTSFIITTDHGRGKTQENWTNHSLFTKGSAQTWLAMMGPGIEPLGEIKLQQQIYQKQIAATIAFLLNTEFKNGHKIGSPIPLPHVQENTAQLFLSKQ
ncbi:MAG: alkaline phosphatase family protein [Bacteroidetes bacterium]|nr:alkaline phosphatase family protein [Bacteroidota bacterium]